MMIDTAQAFTRYAARVSLCVFVIVFAASSWHKLFPSALAATVLSQRRQLGLTFAYVHFVYLIAIGIFLSLSDAAPPLSRLAGGILGYVFIAAMAATSNNWTVSKLGTRNWTRLHPTGVYYLWVAFLIDLSPSPARESSQCGRQHG